jgi:hypothetical protein
MPADIALPDGAQQRIAYGVNQHIAVGVSFQTPVVGYAHTTEHDFLALSKAVNIVAVAYSHDSALLITL